MFCCSEIHLENIHINLKTEIGENNVIEKEYLNYTGSVLGIENVMKDRITLDMKNAEILFDLINKNKELLSPDEYIIYSSNDFSKNNYRDNENAVFGFIFHQQQYHINVKYATLALMCLLFDIAISKGFATFLYGLFGINYSVSKLNDMEKCVTYRLKKEKGLTLEGLIESRDCVFFSIIRSVAK